MADAGRYRLLWCAGAPLAVFLLVLVAAPSFFAPAYDFAIGFGGRPAAVAVVLVFWLLVIAMGLVAIRHAHRAEAVFGVIVGLAVGATLVLLVMPSLINVIRNVVP
jgi:hypothetical protein